VWCGVVVADPCVGLGARIVKIQERGSDTCEGCELIAERRSIGNSHKGLNWRTHLSHLYLSLNEVDGGRQRIAKLFFKLSMRIRGLSTLLRSLSSFIVGTDEVTLTLGSLRF